MAHDVQYKIVFDRMSEILLTFVDSSYDKIPCNLPHRQNKTCPLSPSSHCNGGGGLPLAVVVDSQSVEAPAELWNWIDVVEMCSRLEEANLHQHLKLFATLVEVDETVGRDVIECRVNHCQVGEECSEVWNGSIDDVRLKADET